MRISHELLECTSQLWPRVYAHPFVGAVADGELGDDAFARWVAADHYFNVQYQRFIAGLMATAPNEREAEVMSVGLASNQAGLDRIRRVATRFDLDVDVEPGPTTVGFCAYLQSLLLQGWEVGVAALYACEKVYYDAWSAVRPTARRDTPYWSMIDVWSDEIFGHWISAVCRQLDLTCLDGPTPAMHLAFDRVIRFELLFWTALYAGESW